MDDLRTRLNQYLFYEFGMDLQKDESQVSDTWPFVLREAGQDEASDLIVFEFEADQPYFALAAPRLSFLPRAGMTFDDLLLQGSGSNWIGARDPIDLSTSRPGDDAVPSSLERRRSLQELGERSLPGRDVELLEGLLLRTEQRYLALFRARGAADAVVVGLPSKHEIVVRFPAASSWRRLAWAVGQWLRTEGATAAVEQQL